MKRILITGGCGFIGANIALLARKRGYNVVCLDSLVRPKSEENIPELIKAGVEIVRGDVRNDEDFERCPAPSAIIHLASNPGIRLSIKHPLYDFKVNTIGTLNVLERAKVNKIPVIYASTNKVYSSLVNEIPTRTGVKKYLWVDKNKNANFPNSQLIKEGWSNSGINENFPIDGFGMYSHSPYGVSKLSGDLLCQEYFQIFGVPTVINRMSCIYGIFQKGVEDQGWIDHFLRVIALGDHNLDIYGDGKQVRDVLYGEDLANLYLDELENIEKVKGQIFNVGGGPKNTLSLKEAIEIIENLCGKKAKIKYHPWRHADQKIYISDIEKIAKTLNWKPIISPQDGIHKMYEKYRQSQ